MTLSPEWEQAFANAVLVFILPPSWGELRSRLERRGEDSPEVIELRLQTHNNNLDLATETIDAAIRFGDGAWHGTHAERIGNPSACVECGGACEQALWHGHRQHVEHHEGKHE